MVAWKARRRPTTWKPKGEPAIASAARSAPAGSRHATTSPTAASRSLSPKWRSSRTSACSSARHSPSASPKASSARRSAEHTSELQSLMRTSYDVCGLEKKNDVVCRDLHAEARTDDPRSEHHEQIMTSL